MHSLIDGLAIGVFKDVEDLTLLAISIIVHKIPVSATLGFTYEQSGLKLSDKGTAMIFTLFMLSSPLGVILGSIISENSMGLALSVIQSISGGTFLYLAICDLLMHEFKEKQGTSKNQLCGKISAFTLGCAFVVILMEAIPAHDH